MLAKSLYKGFTIEIDLNYLTSVVTRSTDLPCNFHCDSYGNDYIEDYLSERNSFEDALKDCKELINSLVVVYRLEANHD